MIKTAESTPDEVAYALNGGRYNLYHATKKAKKIDDLLADGFIENNTADPLTAGVEKNNTKVLFRFIKEKLPEATLQYGSIKVADYKITYKSHGFVIHDMRNFGEQINVNDFHNDFPTPETVLNFITKTLKRPIAKKEPSKDEVTRGHLMKLASLGKVTITDHKKMESKIIVQQPKKDRLHKEIERIYQRYKEGAINYTLACQRIKKRVPDVLQKKCLELLKSFRHGTVKWRRVVVILEKDIILPYLEEREKTAKPVRPPKFESPVLWEPIEPVTAVANEIIDAERKAVVKEGDLMFLMQNNYVREVISPDILWMKFDTRGPAGKKYEVVCTVEEYLANVVLHHYPKAMAMLMKVATGEIGELPDVFSMQKHRFIFDAFQTYDPSSVRHPVDRYLFCKLCRNILAIEGVDTCFVWQYDYTLQPGTKVTVWSPMTCVLDRGTVIKNEDGITVRYEHGTVDKVRQGELIAVENWK